MSEFGSKCKILALSLCFPLRPCERTQVGHASTSGKCRLCCKSRFALGFKNSPGRGRGFQIEMRGTSSPRVKLTGNFGNAIEPIRIGD